MCIVRMTRRAVRWSLVMSEYAAIRIAAVARWSQSQSGQMGMIGMVLGVEKILTVVAGRDATLIPRCRTDDSMNPSLVCSWIDLYAGIGQPASNVCIP